jgi:hypothetical protein
MKKDASGALVLDHRSFRGELGTIELASLEIHCKENNLDCQISLPLFSFATTYESIRLLLLDMSC